MLTQSNRRFAISKLYLPLSFSLVFFTSTARGDFQSLYDPEKNVYSGYQDPSEFTRMKTMDESINPSNGVLTLVANDLFLPGRNGMNIEVNRTYNSNVWSDPGDGICANWGNGYYYFEFDGGEKDDGELRKFGAFGLGWDYQIGEIQLYRAFNNGDMQLFDDQSWISLGDGARHEIKMVDYPEPFSYIVPSEPGWKLEFTNSPLAFTVTTGEGTIYYFNRVFTEGPRPYACTGFPAVEIARFWVTKIEDTNGNFINICYYKDEGDHLDCGAVDYDDPGYPASLYHYRIIKKITDNLGREINFHIKRYEYSHYGQQVVRYYVEMMDYIGPVSNKKIVVKYSYTPDFEVINGWFRDYYAGSAPHNQTVILNSVTYNVVNAPGDTVPLAPPTQFIYDQNFGALTQINYPTGGLISYDYARILDHYNSSGNYGFLRLITKTVETPTGGSEIWQYDYGPQTGDYDTYVGTLPYSTNLIESSVGSYGYDHPLPNYDRARITKPTENFTVFHYFDWYDPNDNNVIDFIGQLDKKETYSEAGEKLTEERTYFDRSSNVRRSFWDDFNNGSRNYYHNRSIGVQTYLGDSRFFTENYTFNDLEQLEFIKDFGEVTNVGWNGSFPRTGNFIISKEEGTWDDYLMTENRYLWRSNPDYESNNLFDLPSEIVYYDKEWQIVGYSQYFFDERNESNWNPSGIPPDNGWASPLSNIRGNLSTVKHLNTGRPALTYWFHYDPAGNIIQKIVSPGDDYERSVEYEYSSTYERAYLTGYTLAVDNGPQLSASCEYEFNMGLSKLYTDYNGNEMSIAYDKLNRITKVWFPDPSDGLLLYEILDELPSIEFNYEYGLDWYEVTRTTTMDQDNFIVEKYFVDILNRIGQYQRNGVDSTIFINTNYWYNKLVKTATKPKRIERQMGDPYFIIPIQMEIDSSKVFYDALGRDIESRFTFLDDPPGVIHHNQKYYNSNEMTFRDEDGKETTFLYGARGRQKKVSWGQNPNIKEVIYSYDCMDYLVSVQDADNRTYTYSYDQLGNLIESSMSDQDAPYEFINNPEGKLLYMQDPNRKNDSQYGWLYYIYDNAKRLLEIGLIGMPGDCITYWGPCQTTITLDVNYLDTCDDNGPEGFTAPKTEFAEYFVYFSGPPPSPLSDPTILRARSFRIYKWQFNHWNMIHSVSHSGPGTFLIEAGKEYKIELCNEYLTVPGEYSYATFCYDKELFKDCTPDISVQDTVCLKRFIYDSYDPNILVPDGLDNPLGNLTKALVNNIEESVVDSMIYFYDGRNRLGEKWNLISGLTGVKKIRYEYNDAGMLLSVEYPEQAPIAPIVTYTYDDFGLLSKVGDGIVEDKYASLSYTPSLQIDSIILEPQMSAQIINYQYNPQRNWLTAINPDGVGPDHTNNDDHYSEIITYYTGGYDGANNDAMFLNGVLASIDHSYSYPDNNISRLTHYGYDDRNQLTNAFEDVDSPYNEEFSYHNNRRLDTYKRDNTTHQYFFQASTNRVDHIDNWGQQPGNYQYDHSGNMIADTEKGVSLTWDWRNLPVNTQMGSDYLKFRYDADDNRIRKEYFTQSSSNVNYYIWSDNKPLAQFYEDGSLESINIYAGSKLIAHREWIPQSPCDLPQNCPSDPDTPCSPAGDCEFIPGDVNGNGSGPNIADLTYLVTFLAGGPPPPPPLSRADVDCSGSVDWVDATYLKNFLQGSGIPPICCYYQCGTLYYHLADHLGSTRALIDSTGRMYAAYDYYATGDKTDLNWEYRGTDDQFLGKEFDEEGGFDLSYLHNRYYDSKMFMFVSIEPLLLGPNVGGPANNINYSLYLATPYTYAMNNPIQFLDPEGTILYVAGDTAAARQIIEDIIDDPWNAAYIEFKSVGGGLFEVVLKSGFKKSTAGAKLIYTIVNACGEYVFNVTSSYTAYNPFKQKQTGTQNILPNEIKSLIKNGIQTVIIQYLKAMSTLEPVFGDAEIVFHPKAAFTRRVRGSSMPVEASKIAFHELAEAYYMVEEGIQRYSEDKNVQSAHAKAAADGVARAIGENRSLVGADGNLEEIH